MTVATSMCPSSFGWTPSGKSPDIPAKGVCTSMTGSWRAVAMFAMIGMIWSAITVPSIPYAFMKVGGGNAKKIRGFGVRP